MSNNRSEGSFYAQSQTPDIQVFQLGRGGLGSLEDSVNLFRGEVNLPLPLVDLPIDGGPNISITAMYSSNAYHSVTSWNLSTPTSILGLGWSLSLEQIVVVNQGTGTLFDDEFYYVGGGNSALLSYCGQQEQTLIFHSDQYPLWQIKYNPQQEKWTILKEDGCCNVFGDKESDGNTLQYGVQWGNWIGASVLGTDNINQVVTTWNLSQQITSWGTFNKYSYVNDDVVVATNNNQDYVFTRASYLQAVTDPLGRKVEFDYCEKAENEYLPPHIVPERETLVAYQEKYETKFLTSIRVCYRDQSEHYTLIFEYYPKPYNYYKQQHGSSNQYADYFAKRLLKSVSQQRNQRNMFAPIIFEYDTATEAKNPGAITKIYYPQGGTVSYSYKQKKWQGQESGDINVFDKNIAIDKPFSGKTIPRVWFGPDYILLLWFSGQQKTFQVQIFQLGGRWSQPWTTSIDIEDVAFSDDLVNLRVAIGVEYCVLYLNSKNIGAKQVYVFHKQKYQFGEWKQQTFTVERPQGFLPEETVLTAGNNFYVLYLGNSQVFYRGQYNRLQQQWNQSEQNPTTNFSKLFIAARDNFYIVGHYNAGGVRKPELHYEDLSFQWKVSQLDINFLNIEPATNFWSLGASFAVANYQYQEQSDPNISIIMWDEKFQLVSNEEHAAEFLGSIVSGSTVGNGKYLYHYNGRKWLRDEFDEGNRAFFAYKDLFAIHWKISGSNGQGYIAEYNPYGNSGQGRWDFRPVSGSQEANAVFPATVGENFISFGHQLYYQTPDANQQKIKVLPGTAEGESFENMGDVYFVYENQQASDITVKLFQNNDIRDSKNFNQKIRPENYGQPGTILVGGTAFITFPVNQRFDSATTLYLHRILNASLDDEQIDIVVSSSQSDDGYQKLMFHYEYDSQTAVFDISGRVVQYPKATVYHQDEDGKEIGGKKELYYHNGLYNPQQPIDNAFNRYYSMFSGLLYKAIMYDQNDNIVSTQEHEWQGLELKFSDESQVGVLLPSIIPVSASTAKTQSGFPITLDPDNQEKSSQQITQKTAFEYDLQTGFVIGQSYSNYNSCGKEEDIKEITQYAWTIPAYQQLKDAHRLTIVVQNMKKNVSANCYISAITTTFQPFNSIVQEQPNTVWAGYQTYLWKGPANQVPKFDFQTGAQNAGWLKKIEIQLRHPNSGNVVEVINVNGSVSSNLFDTSGYLKSAQFANAHISTNPQRTYPEAGYFGFEPYEQTQNWQVEGNGDLNSLLYTGDFHTGSTCLRLIGGNNSPVVTNVFQISQAGRYYFSCWSKTTTDFKESDDISWKFIVDGNSLVTTPIKNTQGQWGYLYQYIEISGPSSDFPLQLTCQLSNGVEQQTILVDNISFSPVLGSFTAVVYSTSDLTIAKLGMNGETIRFLYNSFDMHISQIGENGSPSLLQAHFNARRLSQIPDWQTSPNSLLKVIPTQAVTLINFQDQNWQKYLSGKQQNWQVQHTKLTHISQQRATVSLPMKQYSNFGVRVTIGCTQSPQSNREFEVKIGSNLTIKSKSDKSWQLFLQGDVVDSYQGKKYNFPVDFLLLKGTQGVMVFIAGQQILTANFSETITGDLSFCSYQNGLYFANILLFGDPITYIYYRNGGGQNIQFQSLCDEGVIVNGALYDTLGQPVIGTKSMIYQRTLLGYQKDFISGIDWDSGAMSGDISGYYDGSNQRSNDQFFPYSRQLHDNSPLLRVMASSYPGKALAIRPGNEHHSKYEYLLKTQDGFLDYLPQGEYTVSNTIDADGNQVQKINDKLGNLIGERLIFSDTNGSSQMVSFEYNDLNQLVTTKLPNYYATPKDSKPEFWKIQKTYDYFGNIISLTTPDTGSAEYIYNQAGRFRFLLPQKGKKAGLNGTDRIIYQKYDSLGRVVSNGYWDTSWNRDTLQKLAEDSSEPKSPTFCSMVRSYDGPDDKPYALGRISSITTYSELDNSAVKEIFDYDINGNIINKETITNSSDYITSYQYNVIGRVELITYPHLPGQAKNAKQIWYSYNSIGLLYQVGRNQDDDKETYVSLSYNADIRIEKEIFKPQSQTPIERKYSYNSEGKVINISDPYFSEVLTYHEAPGYKGVSYYRGLISTCYNKFNRDLIANLEASEFRWLYQYSPDNYLIAAENQNLSEYSIGVKEPTVYDANGNLLTLQMGEQNSQQQYWNYNPSNNQVINTIPSDHTSKDFQYDGSGNTITTPNEKHQKVTYNFVNDLTTTIAAADKTTLAMSYGASKQRVSKKVVNAVGQITETQYLLDVNNNPLVVKQGEKVFDYVYTPSGILTMEDGDNICYYLKDHLRSTRVVVGEKNTVYAALSYLPFGGAMGAIVGEVPNNVVYRYTSQEWDQEVELYYYKARIYNPQLRRFYSPDPKNQYASSYIYVGNNPILLSDPSGEASAGEWLTTIGGVAFGGVLIAAGIALTIPTMGASETWAVAGVWEEGASLATMGAFLSASTIEGTAILFATGSAAISAGVTSAEYSAEHLGDFKASDWGKAMGVSALQGFATGLVAGGGSGYVSKKVFTEEWALKSFGKRVFAGFVLGASSGSTDFGMQLASNKLNGEELFDGAARAGAEGFVGGALTGGVGAFRAASKAIKGVQLTTRAAEIQGLEATAGDQIQLIAQQVNTIANLQQQIQDLEDMFFVDQLFN